MILFIYLSLCYMIAGFVEIATYMEEGQLTVKDLLMFILAPFSMIPVVFVHLISHFIDLDKVIVRK